MPDHLNQPSSLIDALRSLTLAVVAYAVGVAIVASCLLPFLLSADPVARLLPKTPAVVARLPQAAPQTPARAGL
jgi:hypothetical protein